MTTEKQQNKKAKQKISGKHWKTLENQFIILKSGIGMERIKHLAGLSCMSHTTVKSEGRWGEVPPYRNIPAIQPGLVICFTLDNIHVSMLFSQNIPSSPSPTESKSLFCTQHCKVISLQLIKNKWEKIKLKRNIPANKIEGMRKLNYYHCATLNELMA